MLHGKKVVSRDVEQGVCRVWCVLSLQKVFSGCSSGVHLSAAQPSGERAFTFRCPSPSIRLSLT